MCYIFTIIKTFKCVETKDSGGREFPKLCKKKIMQKKKTVALEKIWRQYYLFI